MTQEDEWPARDAVPFVACAMETLATRPPDASELRVRVLVPLEFVELLVSEGERQAVKERDEALATVAMQADILKVLRVRLEQTESYSNALWVSVRMLREELAAIKDDVLNDPTPESPPKPNPFRDFRLDPKRMGHPR
jgi:uncharacterized coiled-coil protein SlyX